MGSSRELASHSTLRRATRLSRGRNARAPGLSGPAKRHGLSPAFDPPLFEEDVT